MKKLFKKILEKLIKKAVKKAVIAEVPEVEPIEPGFESELNTTKVPDVTVKGKAPWWVIVLKVLAYIIGLILGGVVTTSCASHIF